MVNGFVYTSVFTWESRTKSCNQTEAFDFRDTLVRLSCRVGVLFGQLFSASSWWRTSFENDCTFLAFICEIAFMEYASLAQTTCKSEIFNFGIFLAALESSHVIHL